MNQTRKEEILTNDAEIVALYRNRSESAIRESDAKYGRYCFSIAYSILCSREDAEECLNDTWRAAWESIPPKTPEKLGPYLGKLTRTIAIDRLRYNNAEKRGGGQFLSSYEELSECLPDEEKLRDDLEEIALSDAISAFLRTLPKEERLIFLRRYWYFDSIDDIARTFWFGKSKIKMTLMRTRKKLGTYLRERGLFYETKE